MYDGVAMRRLLPFGIAYHHAGGFRHECAEE